MERPPDLFEERNGKRWSAHPGHAIESRAPWSVATVADRGKAWATMTDSRGFESSSESVIEIDGSQGEGGGQILRTSLSLSLLTGRPFRIRDIRSNRAKPGLRPQHLAAVSAAARLGEAVVKGAEIGSRVLSFSPRPDFEPRDLTIDVGTAGSTALILQTLALPIALRADAGIRVSLTGGTFNADAPSYPFLETTWRAYQTAIGLSVGLRSSLPGFYPKGGGRLEAWIEPGAPRARRWIDRGKPLRIRGVAEVARLSPSIAERMRTQALERFDEYGLELERAVETVVWSVAPGPGAAISLAVEFESGLPATVVALGALGKPAEAVADEAVDQVWKIVNENAAVDRHSADQILLPLACAEGPSAYSVAEISEHLRTNIQTIRSFIDRPIRAIEARANEPASVEIA